MSTVCSTALPQIGDLSRVQPTSNPVTAGVSSRGLILNCIHAGAESSIRKDDWVIVTVIALLQNSLRRGFWFWWCQNQHLFCHLLDRCTLQHLLSLSLFWLLIHIAAKNNRSLLSVLILAKGMPFFLHTQSFPLISASARLLSLLRHLYLVLHTIQSLFS